MTPAADPAPRPARPGRRLALFVPLLVFAGLTALFLVQLAAGPPSRLPSALIGRPVPSFTLPPIAGSPLPGLETAHLAQGRVTLVNVWASWCGPCRDEHPVLMALAGDPRFDMVGLNNKDLPENARRFLAQLGNPFSRVGADTTGRVAIDWGVYGVPETFIVTGAGLIAHKHVGPLTPQIVRERLMPAIEAALRAGPASPAAVSTPAALPGTAPAR